MQDTTTIQKRHSLTAEIWVWPLDDDVLPENNQLILRIDTEGDNNHITVELSKDCKCIRVVQDDDTTNAIVTDPVSRLSEQAFLAISIE